VLFAKNMPSVCRLNPTERAEALRLGYRRARRSPRFWGILLVHLGNTFLFLMALLRFKTPLGYIFFPAWLGIWAAISRVQFAILNRFVLEANPHLCRQCGYDLTGNASGVCPECGTAVVQRQVV
jgi:hypothetical protein